MTIWLFVFPIIAAFIGWLIHWAAFKMLFRPVQTRRIMGIGIQGLVPSQQHNIGEKLGKIANEQFLTAGDIGERISNPDLLKKILPTVEVHIDEFLRTRLGKTFPMLSMFIGEKTIGSLKAAFMDELQTLFPVLMKQYAEQMIGELNIEHWVAGKVNSIASNRLESMILDVFPTAGRNFMRLGALTGFIVGLIQVAITLLLLR
jgi:uncharacterized membrane protein YheB (UPF0754 family)